MDDRDRAVSRSPLPVVNEGVLDSILASTRSKPLDISTIPEIPYTKSHGGSAGEWVLDSIDRVSKLADASKRVYEGTLDPLSDEVLETTTNFAGGMAGSGFGKAALSKPTTDVELGIFAGTRAKTADLDALNAAKEAALKGRPAEDVWANTGWLLGPDGKWRFEIPDNMAYVKRPMVNNEPFAYLEDTLHHPEFYKAYPEAGRKIAVDRTTDLGGSFSPQGLNKGYIQIPSDKTHDLLMKAINPSEMDKRFMNQKAVLLHELQHWLQRREGFATGGSPEGIMREVEAAIKKNPDKHREAASILRQGFDAKGGEWMGDVAYEAYRRLGGESEARLAADRMQLTPLDRMFMYPNHDVPRDKMIVRVTR